MKSQIEKYVLSHLNDDDHHFELPSDYIESLGVSFDDLCSMLSQLEDEGKFVSYVYDDCIICEAFPPCCVPEIQSDLDI